MEKETLLTEEKTYATAPYNFVSMTGEIVPSPLGEYLEAQGFSFTKTDSAEREEHATEPDKARTVEKKLSDLFRDYLREAKTLSGYLELTIKTVMPVFIGGGTDGFTFSPAGRPLIPGSSLRGMMRSLLKIITAGSMKPFNKKTAEGDFSNRHLFYRDVSALNNIRPGFLVQFDDEKEIERFRILETSFGTDDYKGTVICKSGSHSCSRVEWVNKGKTAKVYTVSMAGKEILYEYNIDETLADARVYEVPIESVIDYRSDAPRKGDATCKRVNILKPESDGGGMRPAVKTDSAVFGRNVHAVAPCFFLLRADGSVKGFGHGKSFRIPYDKPVSSFFSLKMRDDAVIDFADALFGKPDCWASRLFFEDGELVTDKGIYEAAEREVLATPNPTSYQLYGVQGAANKKNWDSTVARGYKLYWHRYTGNHKKDDYGWKADPNVPHEDKNENFISNIRPLRQGNEFHARIRFMTLREEELGALCKLFLLGKNACFQIGQGKPIGLGTVKIDAVLHVETDDRYKTLFVADEGGTKWADGNATDGASMETYAASFDTYMKENMNDSTRKWYEKSMADLLDMLCVNTPDGAKKVPAGEIDLMKSSMRNGNFTLHAGFKKRYVLRTVEKITGRDKNAAPATKGKKK